MILLSTFLSQLAQQLAPDAEWWWLFLIGLVFLVGFFYWWRRVSEEDLEITSAFEREYPQNLALAAGYSPATTRATAVTNHEDHGEHAHADPQAAEAEAVAAPPAPDNLQRIEGIGPKIAELLNAAGIYTFGQLADAETADLQTILEQAGSRYQLADPTSWPQQAKLAALAGWAGLDALQETLIAGRRAE